MCKKCCFIGHRKIKRTKELEKQIYDFLENLIENEKVDTFLFGSRSEFNDLCYQIVSRLKQKYKDINRVYVRGEYQYIDDGNIEYFSKGYEKTYLPESCKVASRGTYIERNRSMIDESDFCLFYYIEGYTPPARKRSKKDISVYQTRSGTAICYRYATKEKKNIKNFYIN